MTSKRVCYFCNQELKSDLAKSLTDRGVAAIIEASKRREDGKHLFIRENWRIIEFHTDCRRDYCNINCIERDSKKQKLLKAGSKRQMPPDDSGPSLTRAKKSEFLFDFFCLFCGCKLVDVKKRKKDRQNTRFVATSNVKESILKKCQNNYSPEAQTVKSRVENIDLVEKKASYHVNCYSNFLKLPDTDASRRSKGRQTHPEAENSFQSLFEWLDDAEETQFTLHQLLEKMSPYKPSLNFLKKTLSTYYGNSIVFNKLKNRKTIVTFRKHIDTILNDAWYQSRDSNEANERKRVIKAAADLIRSDIGAMAYNTDEYPAADEFLQSAAADIPESLQLLLEAIILPNKKANNYKNWYTKVISIAHAIIAATRPRGFISCIQLGLAVYLHRKFGSQLLVDITSNLGYCSSYKAVSLYESSVVMQSNQNQPSQVSTKLLKQFVYDNVDSNINTEDGKNTLHCMGGVEINTPADDCKKIQPVLKLKEKPSAALIALKGKVDVNYYNNPEKGSLSDIKFLDIEAIRPLDPQKNLFSCTLIAWFAGKSLGLQKFPGWHGYMEDLSKNNTYKTTKIQALPFIDLQATNKDAINTCLHYASQEFKRVEQKKGFVTFDQQLYQKAREILATYGNEEDSELSNVIVRLGGFHLLMSYLGALGNIMDGSGLKNIFTINYAENSTPKILSGHHYARAVRAHLLTVNALMSILFEELGMSTEEKMELKTILSDSKQTLDALAFNEIIIKLCANFQHLFNTVAQRGKTAKLWIQYIDMVVLFLDFIHAERVGDFELHLNTVQKMLPYFHAGGHTKYAKSAQLYLQDMLIFQQNKDQYPEVYKNYVTNGYFTIKRTDKFWSGTSPDMIIEQFLMRSIKAVGGITRRGYSASTAALWILTMPATVELCNSLEKFCKVESHTTEQHVDARESNIKRFDKQTSKIITWLELHPPFLELDDIKSIGSGIIGDETINCWNALEIGKNAIARQLEKGADFGNIVLPRTDKVLALSKVTQRAKNFSKSSDKSFDIPIDSTILFHRIMHCNKDSEELEECFSYEMTPIPLALFDEGGMRKVDDVSVFSAFTAIQPPKLVNPSYIIDGDELITRIPWQKNMSYKNLYEETAQFVCRHYTEITSIVFETKNSDDPTILDLRESSYHDILFDEDGIIPLNKNKSKFLSNQKNKSRLISQLVSVLEKNNIKVNCVNNTPSYIADTAIQSATESRVIVVSQNPDVLILLIAHSGSDDIIFHNPGMKKVKEQWYSVSDIKKKNPELPNYVLFLHAATGCKTTSSIYKKGKKTVFKLASKLSNLEKFDIFNIPNQDPEEIAIIGEQFLLNLYTAPTKIKSINRLRYIRFAQQSMKSKTGINVAALPPTSNAAKQHFLRVYRQINEWKGESLKPEEWGWILKDSHKIVPNMTSNPIAPEQLLTLVSCGCKKGCSSSCSCRKAGLPCSSVCKYCFGSECTNSSEIMPEDIDVGDINDNIGSDPEETDVENESDNHSLVSEYAKILQQRREEEIEEWSDEDQV